MNDLIKHRKDSAVAEVEDARARQRFLADYEARVQHGARRVHGLVPTGAPARLHQGYRQRVAGIARGPPPRFVLHHYQNVGDP